MSTLTAALWALVANVAIDSAQLPPVGSFPVSANSEAKLAGICAGGGSVGAPSNAAMAVAKL